MLGIMTCCWSLIYCPLTFDSRCSFLLKKKGQRSQTETILFTNLIFGNIILSDDDTSSAFCFKSTSVLENLLKFVKAY